MVKLTRTAWLFVANTLALILAMSIAIAKLLPEGVAPESGKAELGAPGAVFPNRQTSIENIEQSPLFSQSRKPPDVVPISSFPMGVAAGPPPALVGIVGEGSELHALLEDPSSNTRKLIRQGEQFIGWTLVTVDSKRAELRAAETTIFLDLSLPRQDSNNANNIQGATKQ